MNCVVIPVIAALAASGQPVSHADRPDAPRGAIAIAQVDGDGSILSSRTQTCSALTGCSAPIQIGKPGLERIRLVFRPDGGAGMHVHAVVEDDRGRELDAPSSRLCWRSTGVARGDLLLKPLKAPAEAKGLRLPRPQFDDGAETLTLAIAITPGL